jgi:hypothetical protein
MVSAARIETPVLRLGLIGFNKLQEQRLALCAAQYRHAHWRPAPIDGADAWLVNGARIARVSQAGVRVIASEETIGGTALLLDVSSRPTAIAEPAPHVVDGMIRHRMDLKNPQTVIACLASLDSELARMRRLYWTAASLVEGNATVGRAVYELRAGAHLLAIADMKGFVYCCPDAPAESFQRATWKHRARKSIDVPDDFEKHVLSELLWEYLTRTRRDLLPQRYRECPIHLRRPPRVPPHLVHDLHLTVIRELAVAPLTFSDLMDALDLEDKRLARALAALYFVGSITSNAERAWNATQHQSAWSSRAEIPQTGCDDKYRSHEGQPSTAPMA